MNNFKNPNPECPREDCRFTTYGGETTCMAFIPIYDKNGVNINPDRNKTYFTVDCVSCGKKWAGKIYMGETTYEEVKQ
jgi:hypothetical protein